MNKYIFTDRFGKKVTKYEIVAETLREAQMQLSAKLEIVRGISVVGVGLPDYVEPVDYPADITLKTYNITYRPDPDVHGVTETITYKADSTKSATGKFLEDFPDQAGQYRETHSPLGNYAVDRKNAETQNNDNKSSEDNPPTDTIREPNEMKKPNILKVFKTVNEYVRLITLLLIGLIPLLLLGVVIFGDDFVLGNVVVWNIQNMLDGMAGFVGIMTLLVIVYFYTRMEQKEK